MPNGYWRLLGHYDAETATYSACVGAFAPSPYTPDKTGILKGLRVLIGRTAATTLTDEVQFRLTCTTFNPNVIECMGVGSGIQTAPAQPAPSYDFSVSQPVIAGVPITIEARCGNAAAVTNAVYLWGYFE